MLLDESENIRLEGAFPVLHAKKMMTKLPIQDARHLSAAEGWLDLGDHISANDELELISASLRAHPMVLMVRCNVYAKAGKWDEVCTVADALVKIAPEESFGWVHRSFALHEMKRTDEALQKLLAVADKFPGDHVIPYNLACYACQLGKIEEAEEWIDKAIKSASVSTIKEMALNDPDLEPMWEYVGGM